MSERTVFGRPLTSQIIGAVVAAAVVLVLVVAGAVWLVARRGSHSGAQSTTPPGTTGSSSTGASGSSMPAGPALAGQFRLGAWAGSVDQSSAGRIAAFDSLQSSVNVDLSIVHVYRGKLDAPIGGAIDTTSIAAGKTLLISWAGGDTVKTAAGDYDAIIAQRAREVAALKVPVYFEYRWEMDRANLGGVVHSPADYIAAWKHVREIFAEQKVTNAEFVWCPQASAFATGAAQKYYPGDDSVDWICADLYPPIGAGQTSFATVAAPFLAWANPHHKPIMFGEFGVPKSYGAKRAAWLASVQTVVTQNPLIRALVYFNAVGTHQDYSLSDDTRALAALAALGRGLGVKAAR